MTVELLLSLVVAAFSLQIALLVICLQQCLRLRRRVDELERRLRRLVAIEGLFATPPGCPGGE